MAQINLENIFFKYESDQNFSLNINQFTIKSGDHIFIEGPSGCGKTTFLNILTGLIKPLKGSLQVLGTDISSLSQGRADQFRAEHFGIIFQCFNLIPYLSVTENIILPCMFSKERRKKALSSADSLELSAQQLCNELNIERYLIEKPVDQLSIGQQQRVAIARALIGQPEIIIADEPTSALDNQNTQQFITMLLENCTKFNMSLLFVSHDVSLKSQFKHSFNLTNQSNLELNRVSA